MTNPLGKDLFAFESKMAQPSLLRRRSARDLGLQETWFRDAIYETPELVIGPCRAGGITDEEWYAWAREYSVEVGSIDVLLVSSQGRIGIVETKLASNSELRRQVLAQTLDYLTHLHEALEKSPPDIPKDESGQPVAFLEDVLESAAQGDVLVIIASDNVDPRVARLSRDLIGKNIVKQWDLALIDLGLYQTENSSNFIMVPCVRSLVQADPRQVVKVIVKGETPKARVEVEHIRAEDAASGRRQWNEAQFFESLQKANLSAEYRKFVSMVRNLARSYPDSLRLVWGTGKSVGSMILKRNNAGLIELYDNGQIWFRRAKFATALGNHMGEFYSKELDRLIPSLGYNYQCITAPEVPRVAPALFELIKQVVEQAERAST